eukprot:TRINITY_DN78439_c0_g1_i1.p1 TRINITY_DN78439_c0_g1~~TRINITY_DN78439_c0_g1_i1.p1  ORF type:complete len:180 (-),score=1.80 TRINITY_DN78439_c0_g1_i1:118-621(-)
MDEYEYSGWDFAWATVNIVCELGQVYIAIFYIIAYTEYKDDHNGYSAVEVARRCNSVFMIELLIQAVAIAALLVGENFVFLLVALPVFCYQFYKFHTGAYILRADTLYKTVDWNRREGIYKLAGFTLMSIVYIAWLIHIAVKITVGDWGALLDVIFGVGIKRPIHQM